MISGLFLKSSALSSPFRTKVCKLQTLRGIQALDVSQQLCYFSFEAGALPSLQEDPTIR